MKALKDIIQMKFIKWIEICNYSVQNFLNIKNNNQTPKCMRKSF